MVRSEEAQNNEMAEMVLDAAVKNTGTEGWNETEREGN